MTDTHKDFYVNQLLESQQAFMEILQQVSLSEFQQKPSPNAWSVAEVIEHVVQVERSILFRIKKLGEHQCDMPIEPPMTDDRVMELSASREFRANSTLSPPAQGFIYKFT